MPNRCQMSTYILLIIQVCLRHSYVNLYINRFVCCREEDATSPSSTSFVKMDKVATDPAPATSEETCYFVHIMHS